MAFETPGDLRGYLLGELAAVEEPDPEARYAGRSEPFGDVEGCLVLIDVTGSDVPGLYSLARPRSLAEGLGGSIGWILPARSAPDAAVVIEVMVDLAPGLVERRSPAVEVLRSAELLLDG